MSSGEEAWASESEADLGSEDAAKKTTTEAKPKAKKASSAPAAKAGGGRGRNTAGGAGASSCLVCTEPRYRKTRWCTLHNRAFNCMKSQAQDHSEQAAEAFDKAMVRDEAAADAMRDWEKVNPASAKWRKTDD